MANLDTVLARRAVLARQRESIDAEDADLAIAERVLRTLDGEDSPFHARWGLLPTKREPRSDAHSSNSPAGQQGIAIGFLPLDGSKVHRDSLRTFLDESRSEALSDNAFATLLSRLYTGGWIEREGEMIGRSARLVQFGSPKPQEEEEADVSATG